MSSGGARLGTQVDARVDECRMAEFLSSMNAGIGESGKGGRRHVARLLSILASGVVAAATLAPGLASAQAAPFCAPGEAAAFRFGIAALQERLGSVMGTPLECEHVNAASGDTVQQTTTGLAYFNPAANMPVFTDGDVHYALADGKLVMWRGDAAILPPPSPPEAAYLASTALFRDRLGAMLAQLADEQRLADAGQIDQVNGDELSALLNDFWAARRVIVLASFPPRFTRYVRTMDLALAQALDAGDKLFHARRTDSDTERDTLILLARPLTASSARLQQEAEQNLSTLVPMVVPQQ